MKTSRMRPYRGLLKDNKTAAFLREALDAPVGSTKRQQASKMLRVISKTFDGRGGRGPVVKQKPIQYAAPKRNFNERMFLPRAPRVRVPIGSKLPVYDGKGGPVLNLANPGIANAAGSLTIPQYAPSITSRILGGARALGSNPATFGATTFGIPAAQDAYYGLQDRIFETPANPWSATAQSTVPYRQVLPAGQTATQMRATQQPAPQPTVWGVAGTSNAPQLKGGLTSAVEKHQATQEAGPSADQGDIVDWGSFDESAGGDTTPSINSYPGLQDALNAGKTSTMYAMDAMKDNGGTLQERYDELAGALRKSLDVDSIESRLLQRIGNRQPLEQDLVDYIRGRDEFLNETDGMLERLKVTASKMDTSDPRTRKAIADHGNYLFTLRGRQNKRYIETLKANMDSYDAQTQSLNAVYETKMDEYKTRLATGASILSSEYGMMMDGLKEMYQMAVDSDPNSFAYKKSQAELDSAQYKAVKDALEMEKLMNGINGGFGDGVTDVVEIAKAMKDLNYVDNNGRLQPGAYMANIGNYNGPTHAKFLVDSYMRALTLPDANKNPISASQAKETASSLLTSLDMMYQEQKIDSATYVSFLDQINGSLGATLTREMAGSTAAITGALKKIEEGTGWFKYVPPTEEKLLEGITDPATQDVIKYLYRIFEPVKTEPGSFSAIFKNGDTELPDNLKLQKVMEMYAKSLLPVQNESASPGFSQVGGDTNIAQRIAQTIKTIESGGDYRAKGASGERGAYQFMKSSWQDWAGQYLGNPNAPLTPQNQDAVAIARINDLLSQGYQPDQVALIWNGGSPTIKKGVNSMGVEYDTGAYLQKFKNNFS